MLFELQHATQFQRDNYDLSGSDVAVMVSVHGKFVAWLDDYGTAHVVHPKYEALKEEIEDAADKVMLLIADGPTIEELES